MSSDYAREAAKRVVIQYVDALANHKVEDSYALLSKRDQESLSLADWRQAIEAQEDFLGPMERQSVALSKPIALSNGFASVELSMSLEGLDEPLSQKLTLVDEGDATWRIYFGSDVATGEIFEVRLKD